jgi:hypothetical protein
MMADRFELIARKQEVQRKISRARRELERERRPDIEKPDFKRIDKLETELERLMAQEYSLRLAIDRSGPSA